jgi:hypothetical protein
MAIVLPKIGRITLLGWALNNVTPQNTLLKLFRNDETPDDDSVASDFTVCNDTGYSNKTLAKGTWTVSETAGVVDITYDVEQSWTMNGDGGALVYGYYIVDANTPGTLLWCEIFAAAEPIYDGKVINLTPYIELATAS